MGDGGDPVSTGPQAEDRAAIRFLAWWRARPGERGPPDVADYLVQRPGDARHAARLDAEREALLAPRAPTSAPPSLRMRIGRFEILRELGSGGQGVVYLARDPDLSRQVALKVLHPHRIGGDAKERFKREADALARIEDPGIATVYEVDLEGPTPYLVMRFVPGPSLLDLFARARDPASADEHQPPAPVVPLHPGSSEPGHVSALVRAGLRCARALQRAHEAGVVHRDVKPGNVLISPDGQPVLVDFGLARDDLASRQDLTGSGERPGTPRYMSPEQLLGRGQVDARTDVWSLGVTLFEALTLAHPFLDAPTGSATTVLARAVQDRAARSARKLNPGVPRELEWILGRALEPALERRYPDARALGDELERFLGDQPVEARPPSLLYRSRKLLTRHRTPALALAVVAATFAVYQWRLATAARRMEGIRAAELRHQASVLDTVQWLSSEIDFEQTDVALQDEGPAGDVRAGRMLEQLRAVVAEEGAGDATPGSAIDHRLLRSSLANAEGDFELTLDLLGPDAHLSPDAEGIAGLERLVLLLRAHAQRVTGDDEGALATCERLLEIEPERGNIWTNRGNILADLGRFDEALDSHDRGVEASPDSAWARAQRGNLRHRLRDGEGTLEDFGEAARLAPLNARFRYNYAAVLLNVGREREARSEFDRAIGLAPEQGIAHFGRGRARFKLGDVEGALEDMDRAFELTPEPRLDWYLDRGRVARAGYLHERVLDDVEVYLAARPGDARALELRGHGYQGLGDHEAALADYSASIAAEERAEAYNQRGILLARLGRRDEAIADLDRAHELGHRSRSLTYNRAAVLHDLGRDEEALAVLEEAPDPGHAALRAQVLEALGRAE